MEENTVRGMAADTVTGMAEDKNCIFTSWVSAQGDMFPECQARGRPEKQENKEIKVANRI